MNWGNCDYKQLQRLRDSLATLQSMDMDRFCTEVSKELAARLLALVIPRTPVGQYPKSSGKKGRHPAPGLDIQNPSGRCQQRRQQ